MTVSEYIFDYFAKKGLDTVFMVSGSSSMWLTDSLQRETRYNVICNHHEQACAMSAEVYARIENKPAICLITVGPGATNIITGVAGAFVDSVPMIVLSGQSSSRMVEMSMAAGVRQGGTQSLILNEMIAPITKYFAIVIDENEIENHLEKAYYEATTGRPGPVWLDIPVDIQNKQILKKNEDFLKFVYSDIAKLFAKSIRPLVLAGQGVKIGQAKESLLNFCELYNIPIVTTRMGIDLIESDNDLFVGRPGAYGDRASHYAIQNCDLIICIGTRLAVSCIGYDPINFAKNAIKIWVDIDSKEFKKKIPIDYKIEIDVLTFINELQYELKKQNEFKLVEKKDWINQCLIWRSKYKIVLEDYKNQFPLNSYYVVDEISKRAKKNSSIIVDTGTSCNVVSQTWQIKEGQNYIISGGISCMGYWAGAIGAGLLGKKNKTDTIVLTGDGSFQMNIQELATIKHNNLPLKIFVFDNNGYLLIRLNQHNYMNDRFLGVGPDSGLSMPNFVKVVESYGLKAFFIETLYDLLKLDYIFEIDEPLVCIIKTQELQEMIPRLSSKVMHDGSLKASQYEDLYPFLSDDEHNANMIAEN